MEVQSQKSNAPGPSAEPPEAPPDRVVKARPLKWHQRLAASVIYGLIEMVAWTQRSRSEYQPEVLQSETGPVIFCIWHNRLPFCLIMYRHYVCRKKQPHRLAAIVSASKDGGVVARILEHFRVQPVRGSSSRRGPQALLELTTWAERGYDLAITPDGPRGPQYEVQSGAVALAQLTGRPLVPVCYHLSWKIRLKSWDRFQIPLPFGRLVMKFGKPLSVPRQISDEQRELLRQELQRRLMELTLD